MFGLDPLNPTIAVAEILLLLALAALAGWLLSRLMLTGRIRDLRSAITQKKAELDDCRRSKVAITPVPIPDRRNTGAVSGPAGADFRTEPIAGFPVNESAAGSRRGESGDEGTPSAVNPTVDQLVVDVPPGLSSLPASTAAVEVNTGVSVAGNSEAAVLNRVAARAQELNFDRIGRAAPTDADDLKDIVGVGPFLERKLHAIGIYTYRQLANLTTEDIRQVNDIIEFFPGRIERDDWVGQAKRFHERKYGGRKE